MRDAHKATQRRVLVIDDEVALVELLTLVLSRDYVVHAVTSGVEAIATLENDSGFDAVLCDLMMPGFTGIEVYERAQQLSPELAARFIFMSGGAFTERDVEFLRRHQARCLDKPFHMPQLRKLVDEVIARQESPRPSSPAFPR